MRLIEALAVGVRGAETGTVDVFARGTSTRATVYADAEATTTVTLPATLGAYGEKVCYVEQSVDIRVSSNTGDVVREFTVMDSAGAVEVANDSFTGADYQTGIVAAGNPTTLDSLLDLVKTSFGTTNFNALVGGSSVTVQSALARAVRVFNVKDPTYGATGNGSTDDTSAIQAAITAANAATGGIVYFPFGTYKVTSALTMYAGVQIEGDGHRSQILQYGASSATFDYSAVNSTTGFVQWVRGIRVTAGAANTGSVFLCTGTLPILLDRVFAGSSFTRGNIVELGASSRVFLRNCWLWSGNLTTATVVTGAAGCILHVTDSVLSGWTSGTCSPTLGLVTVSTIYAKGSVFQTGVAGTCTLVAPPSGQLEGSILGCQFTRAGTSTTTAVSVGTMADGYYFTAFGNRFSGTMTRFGGDGTNGTGNVEVDPEVYSETVTTHATVSVQAWKYRSAYITLNNTGGITTIDLSPIGCAGHEFTLFLYNGKGGTTDTVAVSSNVVVIGDFFVSATSGGAVTKPVSWNGFTLTDGGGHPGVRVMRFRLCNVGGTFKWILMWGGAEASWS